MKNVRNVAATVCLAGTVMAVLASLSLKSAAQESASVGRKFAFLVGVRQYKHNDLKNLDYPENDVEELAGVLKRQNFSVTVLTTRAGRTDKDRFPDAANIRRQLAAILKDASKNDLIVVGLAGHGLQPLGSSQSYLCPYDANPSERDGKLVKPETLLSIGEILTQLRESGIGEKLLLVDACRNDPQVRGAHRGVTQVDVSSLPEQTGVLLSCKAGEFSFESKSYGTGHGAFFYEVIEGLNGAAKDEDGDVTWDSLQSYVRKHVRAAVQKVFGKDGGDQSPNAIGNLTGEPTVLTRITPSTTPELEKPKPEAPELLVAPSAQKEALSARKAWARYLQIDEEKKNSIGMELVLIPPGRFSMGRSETNEDLIKVFPNFKYFIKAQLPADKKDIPTNEVSFGDRPVHRVTISRPLYMAKYEVTKGQFRKFVEDTGYRTDAEKDGKGGEGYTGNKENRFEQRASFTWRDWGVDQSDESPVVNVSHNDAVAFCEWLSRKEKKKYRVPTEAEWEYACRAGTTGMYYNGNDPEDLTKIGNVWDAAAKETVGIAKLSSSDGWALTSPVGQFRPNNFGLYDMIGNASECCSDWYGADYYLKSPERDPAGPSTGSFRVYRGGSWLTDPVNCHAASRGWALPDSRSSVVGFRVVCGSEE